LDDVLVYGKTRNECLKNCKWVLSQFRKYHLYCKITKCEFFPSTTEYLGYAIKNGSYLPLNINKLESLVILTNVKELKGLLGLLQWFSPFITDLDKYTAPLFEFCKPDKPWNQSEIKTLVQEVKSHIELNPLAGHNDSDQFIIATDASDFWASGLLYQRFGGMKWTFNPADTSISEKVEFA